MEHICNFWLSKKQTQKQNFDRAHNARKLEEIGEKNVRVWEDVAVLEELIFKSFYFERVQWT